MKPVVKCLLLSKEDAIVVGERVWIVPYNHPNHKDGHHVLNGESAITTEIQSHTPEASQFKTKNTIYQYEIEPT